MKSTHYNVLYSCSSIGFSSQERDDTTRNHHTSLPTTTTTATTSPVVKGTKLSPRAPHGGLDRPVTQFDMQWEDDMAAAGMPGRMVYEQATQEEPSSANGKVNGKKLMPRDAQNGADRPFTHYDMAWDDDMDGAGLPGAVYELAGADSVGESTTDSNGSPTSASSSSHPSSTKVLRPKPSGTDTDRPYTHYEMAWDDDLAAASQPVTHQVVTDTASTADLIVPLPNKTKSRRLLPKRPSTVDGSGRGRKGRAGPLSMVWDDDMTTAGLPPSAGSDTTSTSVSPINICVDGEPVTPGTPSSSSSSSRRNYFVKALQPKPGRRTSRTSKKNNGNDTNEHFLWDDDPMSPNMFAPTTPDASLTLSPPDATAARAVSAPSVFFPTSPLANPLPTVMEEPEPKVYTGAHPPLVGERNSFHWDDAVLTSIPQTSAPSPASGPRQAWSP
eukprot:m.107287 g.107287  ORF g.107287 m.107287 type:complete len:442 (-) comp10619_c1_seq3:1307-2632(-)